MKLAIIMRGKAEWRQACMLDVDSQLLVQFANKGRFRRFAATQLTARKLPQTFEMLSLGPLRNQDPAIGVNQGDRGNQKNGLLPSILRSDSRH